LLIIICLVAKIINKAINFVKTSARLIGGQSSSQKLSYGSYGKEGPVMAKTFTLFLSASPYKGEQTWMAVKLAEAALDQKFQVNLVATGDGIYNFLKGQKARGFPNAEEKLTKLIQKGLKVFL